MTLIVTHSNTSSVGDAGIPGIIGPNAWNANHVVSGTLPSTQLDGGPIATSGLSVNTSAAVSSLASVPALSINIGSATGSFTGGEAGFNYLNVSSENVAWGTSGVSGLCNILAYYNFSGSGTRYGVLSNLVQQGGSSNTTSNIYYTAMGGSASASFNAGGTAATSNSSIGTLAGGNFIGVLNSGATDYFAVQGAEIDISLAVGASAYRKQGLLIAQLSTDANTGSADDCALNIGNQPGAIGWLTGIQFGFASGGAPLQTGGTLFKSATAQTVAHGFDLTNFTFSADAFLTTGFKIAGANMGTAFTNYNQATPAGGGAPGVAFGSAVVGVYWGSGTPTISTPQGSLYLRTDGSNTANRAYINTNGNTGWTAILTAS